MNCQAGDLAVVVSDGVDHPTTPSIIGALLKCIRLATLGDGYSGIPAWVFEPLSTSLPSPDHWVLNDAHLRPLRPADGADETLRETVNEI